MDQTVPAQKSLAYMQRASAVIPRGVTSYRRAALRPAPLVVSHAAGSRIVDLDGNEFLDFVGAYGPMFLGHQHPRVIEAARTQLDRGVLYGAQHELEARLAEQVIELVPSAEQVLFTVSGSEADQAALRLARAATGRRAVVKFEGHYHGWIDPFTANGAGTPVSAEPAPVPVIAPEYSAIGDELLVCPWNDIAALERVMDLHGREIAAVFMEPIAINGGNLWAADGYLAAVRELCDRHGVLLVFDEVITGFRVAPGGAQELIGVEPDLTVLAKALGSGFPISAVAGRAAIMNAAIDRVGQGGTYNGNAIVMAAASAGLTEIAERRDEIYPRVAALTERLASGSAVLAASHGLPIQVLTAPSVVRFHWGVEHPVRNYADVLLGRSDRLASLGEALVRGGIHVRENGLWYLSAAHTEADVDTALAALEAAMRTVSE